ncbi:S-adenosyl-L-methionine-dependent methyltransferase [Crepidotus variabilis]|uniref:Protein arginine methyltransferase NDUFAF7 n=1 Tax=Crepidotus variabilis TaxID=179855 RepID=A0A9P6EN67_9AGAR|nr:S-adenosyl-L-methionine-dependent methyltransferase [Crepidotus variabilis]
MIFLGHSLARGPLFHNHRFLFRGVRPFSQTARSLQTSGKSRKRRDPTEPKDKWNYNANPFDGKTGDEPNQLRLVTANSLEKETQPPVGVKMLVRDFIEDSLYNPNYGYFPKQATIFNAKEKTFDFPNLRDSAEFQEEVAEKYFTTYGVDTDGPGRQLWHTPTELFKPWYGRAIGRCLVSEYLLKYFPYEDFVLYEIGAGNGTLAMDILDLIQEEYPEVYERTRYQVIEISESLVKLQTEKLQSVHPCVKISHKSIFHWNNTETAPCFFIAMEVIDNFAHDVLRYDLNTLQPYQGLVTIDEDGDFDVIYTPVTDPLIQSFLQVRHQLNHPPPINKVFFASDRLRRLYASMPFAPNLSPAEYIPTRLLNLVQTLRNYFPRHRLLLSDFSSLPDTIPGLNAPVVQTRFQNVTVPCSTLLVKQGYFDIFFPTDFERLRDMYEHSLSLPRPASSVEDSETETARITPLTAASTPYALGAGFFYSYQPPNRRKPIDGVTSASGLPIGERKSSVFSHSQFLETYAELDKTRLRSGENPMLEFYKNVKFLF